MDKGNAYVFVIEKENGIHRWHNSKTEKNDLDKEEEWWEIDTLVNWLIDSKHHWAKPSDFVDLIWNGRWVMGRFKGTFFNGNGPRKYELKDTLANCKQGGDTVTIYYSKLKKIWAELGIIPNCQPVIVMMDYFLPSQKKEKSRIYVNSWWVWMMQFSALYAHILYNKTLFLK